MLATDETFGMAKVRLQHRTSSIDQTQHVMTKGPLPAQNKSFQGPNLFPNFLLLRGSQSRACRIPYPTVPREPTGGEDVSLRCQISREIR